MIVKILGVLDIFVALVFWLFGMFELSVMTGFILVLGLFLLAKGLVFAASFNLISVLDILSGIIIIAATGFAMPKVIVIIVSLFLLQKGIFSLVS
jgi:hypothetical protein